jgi:hypothetical protein
MALDDWTKGVVTDLIDEKIGSVKRALDVAKNYEPPNDLEKTWRESIIQNTPSILAGLNMVRTNISNA